MQIKKISKLCRSKICQLFKSTIASKTLLIQEHLEIEIQDNKQELQEKYKDYYVLAVLAGMVRYGLVWSRAFQKLIIHRGRIH